MPRFGKVWLPQWLSGKESACSAGYAVDVCTIPGWGRSPEEENGNPPRYTSLKNPMDRGGWWATVHSVAKSQTQLKRLSNIELSAF